MKDKVAIITGGLRGIGLAIVQRFLQADFAVMACSYGVEGVDPVVNEFRGSFPKSDLRIFEGNLTELGNCDRIYERTLQELGSPGVLVNNAASVTFRHVAEASADEIELELRVNVVASWRLSSLCYGSMKLTGGGAIVNVASTHPLRTRPGTFPYNTSKGAILTMTKAMAVDFGPAKVRVNAVLPGIIYTERTQSWLDTFPDPTEKLRQILQTHPLEQLPTAQDCANAVWFLANDDARAITGIELIVDAGRNVLTM